MKKDPNNSSVSASGNDFSLPRSKILRGRKNFQRLFEEPAVIIRNTFVDLRFRIFHKSGDECLMGFVVKKQLGKAVRRNRVKRLLREAYRLNQHLLTDLFSKRPMSFHGVLMAKTLEVSFRDVEDNVKELLQKARDHILSIEQTGL